MAHGITLRCEKPAHSRPMSLLVAGIPSERSRMIAAPFSRAPMPLLVAGAPSAYNYNHRHFPADDGRDRFSPPATLPRLFHQAPDDTPRAGRPSAERDERSLFP